MRINCNFLEFMELKNYIFIKASLNESILKELYFRLKQLQNNCIIFQYDEGG